jgi:predicted transcriptional regulator
MLDLSQVGLAQRCGISKTALTNIERSVSDPKASTLAAIQRVLEEAGVRFTEHGVELPPSSHPDE